jgi:transcriptional regulator with XRE-family HTH domain
LQSRTLSMSDNEHIGIIQPRRAGREAQELIRDLGRWTKRVREFLGYSQDKLAKLADVSQGAVSRVEAGRGIATPMVTFWKINQVFAKALGEIDPSMLSEEARSMLERARYLSTPVPTVPHLTEEREPSPLMLIDPVLTRLISTYQTLPERERRGFLSVLDATANSLSRHPDATGQSVIERAARTPN